MLAGAQISQLCAHHERRCFRRADAPAEASVRVHLVAHYAAEDRQS